jgi:hypothetical protein
MNASSTNPKFGNEMGPKYASVGLTTIAVHTINMEINTTMIVIQTNQSKLDYTLGFKITTALLILLHCTTLNVYRAMWRSVLPYDNLTTMIQHTTSLNWIPISIQNTDDTSSTTLKPYRGDRLVRLG